jgi:WD40 repeat protein
MFSVKGMMFAVAALAVVFLAGCAETRPEPSALDTTPNLAVKETLLGKSSMPDRAAPLIVIASPDGRRYASIRPDRVIIDGKPSRRYLDMSNFAFSPNSKHYAYGGLVKYDNGKTLWVLTVDGDEQGVSHRICAMIWSPDSKRLAYLANEGDNFFFVIDGKREEYNFFSLGKRDLFNYFVESDILRSPRGAAVTFNVFSPDSQHYAYPAYLGDKYVMVRDGVAGEPYDKIETNRYQRVFSPDSKHVEYFALKGEEDFHVIDGVETKLEGEVYFPSWDGVYTVYTLQTANRYYCVVLDGKPGKAYPQIPTMKFSPDLQHLAYVAEIKHGKNTLIVDEKEIREFECDEHVRHIVFSSDSKHIALFAGNTILVDDKKYTLSMIPNAETFVFSPDGKRAAYLVVKGWVPAKGWPDWRMESYSVVVDGKESQVYHADRSEGIFEETDRKVGQSYDTGARNKATMRSETIVLKEITEKYLAVFSPDSRHVAYVGWDKGGKGHVVADDLDVKTECQPQCAPIFDSPTKFHFIGLKGGNEVVLVECEISE